MIVVRLVGLQAMVRVLEGVIERGHMVVRVARFDGLTLVL